MNKLSPQNARFLMLLALCGVACSAQQAKDVVWPTVAKCAPAPATLVADVVASLKSDPGSSLTESGLKALEALAKKHGPELVACAVNDVADRLGGEGDADGARVEAKARDFFAKTGVAVSER